MRTLNSNHLTEKLNTTKAYLWNAKRRYRKESTNSINQKVHQKTLINQKRNCISAIPFKKQLVLH